MKQMSLFDNSVDQIAAQMAPIVKQIAGLPLAEQVEALNKIRSMLHQAGPFRDEPVDCVLWLPADQVQGNDYNPNKVAPPEMRLLKRSIQEDGFTQPIVGWQNGQATEVVDGFHRTRVAREDGETRKRLHGYAPVALVGQGRAGRNERMAATIRHNRARGVHGVMPMTDIVAEMLRQGWSDDQVAAELGMDADEVLKFKHNTGLAELFKDHAYSRAWE